MMFGFANAKIGENRAVIGRVKTAVPFIPQNPMFTENAGWHWVLRFF